MLPVVPVSEDMAEDIRCWQERDAERAVFDWEAPFPMTARTQVQLAENRHRVVRQWWARFAAFMTAGMDDEEEQE